MIKKVLTIAGSDSSGGAGIQADIKTITAHKMYAMSVITALTAQNTMGVDGVAETAPEFVAKQIDSVFADIVPDSVKTGMLANSDIVSVVSEKLRKYGAKNIVIDPVMVSTSGSRLISETAAEAMKKELFPLGTVITPNIPEAEVLCGIKITDSRDMTVAAKSMYSAFGCAVLIKGGHAADNSSDLLFDGKDEYWYNAEKIATKNTHGTGCTLSSAIACALADGKSLPDSVAAAKDYVTNALRCGIDIGHGSGPLNHMYAL